MEKIDARKLSPRELSEKRRIAIKLREKGIANNQLKQFQHIMHNIKKMVQIFLK